VTCENGVVHFMHLTKHEGAGNDFLVVLDPDDSLRLSGDQIRLLCHRHRGIGADGVIRVGRGRGAGGDVSGRVRSAATTARGNAQAERQRAQRGRRRAQARAPSRPHREGRRHAALNS